MALFDVTWSLQVEKLLPPVLRDRDFTSKDGDFLSGDPENDYLEYIIFSSPGHWKEFPVVGFGVYKYLLSTESPQVLQRNLLVQLKNDIFPKPFIDVSKFPVMIVNNVTIKADASI